LAATRPTPRCAHLDDGDMLRLDVYVPLPRERAAAFRSPFEIDNPLYEQSEA
jgi:hypothetical protein